MSLFTCFMPLFSCSLSTILYEYMDMDIDIDMELVG